MGGDTKQQQSQTTTTSLPQNQQTNVDALMAGALDYYNSGGRQFYGGDGVANFNPYQLAGQEHLLNFAGGQGQDFANQAMASNQFFMDPNNIMNPDNIPGYREAQDATSRKYTQNLTENILPYVRGGATQASQYGGSASGIGQALSVDRSSQALADSLANMDVAAYTQGLNAFNQAQNRAPALFQLGSQPGAIMAGVGDATQNQEQREIDFDISRHMFEQNEPAVLLQLLQGLTGSAGQYGGTVDSNSTTTQSGGNPLTQALGLGLMGASVFGGGGGIPGGMPGKGEATAGADSTGGSVAPIAYMGKR